MSTWEIVFWIALPSAIALLVVLAVLLGIHLRRRTPPIRRG